MGGCVRDDAPNAHLNATVVGIDVGGQKKGFHAVALWDGKYYGRFHSRDVEEMAAWVLLMESNAVGIDAPCRWSTDGRMRCAERELAKAGMPCFATPTREKAEGHTFYAWMRNGMMLYDRLTSVYPLFDGTEPMTAKVCFETFPQAIACALAGRKLAAKNKRSDRLRLLEEMGIATSALNSIDFIDAALCAIAAYRFMLRRYESIGNAQDGFIIVPVTNLSLF
jgi:predicted nuclease with RNAse H fold